MNSAESIIREKLKAALANEKMRVASTLIMPTTLPEPPIAGQGPISPTFEAFSKDQGPNNGRPLSASPSQNAPMRRQKKMVQLAKAKEQLQKTQSSGKSKDVRVKNAKLAAGRLKVGMLQQQMATIK